MPLRVFDKKSDDDDPIVYPRLNEIIERPWLTVHKSQYSLSDTGPM
jgi:hypothetical protein